MKYLPDTHAALYADDIVHVLSDRQAHPMLQRTEMAMFICNGRESQLTRRFERQGECINILLCDIPKLNAFLQFRSSWTNSPPSTATKRKHIRERCCNSTTPPHSVTRTLSSELQPRDISVILPFHMHAINLSIHRYTGSAKHRRLLTISDVAESLGEDNYIFGQNCPQMILNWPITVEGDLYSQK